MNNNNTYLLCVSYVKVFFNTFSSFALDSTNKFNFKLTGDTHSSSHRGPLFELCQSFIDGKASLKIPSHTWEVIVPQVISSEFLKHVLILPRHLILVST